MPLALLAGVRRPDPGLRPLWIGVAGCTVLSVAALVLLAVDQRTLDGVPVWVKPLKFAVSNGLFMGTLAWILPHLTEAAALVRRAARGIATLLLLETALIATQAARGVHSHFNTGTLLDALIISVMGVMIAGVMLLLVAIARAFSRQRTGEPVRLRSIRLALWLSIAGAGIGGAMTIPRPGQLARFAESPAGSVLGAHTIGGADAPVDGGTARAPLYWSQNDGDLRASHFVGLHALQVILVVGALVRRAKRTVTVQMRALGLAAMAYAGLMAATLVQALRREPPFSPGGLTLVILLSSLLVAAAAVGSLQRAEPA